MSHLETMRTVLVIYTGGTIGMTRDKVSGALVPLDFAQVAKHVPELAHAGIRVEAVSFDVPMDSSDDSEEEAAEEEPCAKTQVLDGVRVPSGFHGSFFF